MAGERTVRVRFVGDASSAVSAGKAAEKAVVGALSAQEGAAQKLVAAQAKAAAQVEAIQARGAAAAAAIGTKAAATAEATIAKGAAAQVRAAAAIEAAHIRAATAAGATAAKVAIEQERSAARTAQAHIKAAAQVESASVRAASGSSKAFLSMGKALDNVRAFALKAIVAFAGFSAIKNFLGGAIKDATENATASTEKVLARLKVAGDFFQTEVKEKIGAALLSFFDVIVQKLMPAIQQIVSGVGPVADVARAFGAAWQVAADIVMAVAVPAFEVAKATVEGVRVAIEEASDSPVTWAEIFAASASTITTTANDIKIRVDQAFTIMAGAATFAFLKIPIVVGNALAKVLELAVSALQKAASIIPADLGGDLIQKIADKAAGMGVSLRAGAADGQQAIDDLFDKVVQLNDGIGKQGDVLDAVGPKQEDHTRRTKEQREEAEKFQKALDSMLASVGAFTFAEITNQTKLFVAALASVPKGSQAYAELTIKVGEFADKLAGAGKEVPAALREIADDVRGFIGPALEEAADREKRIGEEATKAAAAVDGLRSSLGLITQSDFDSKLALMTNELERLKGLPGTEVAVADLTDQMAKMG